MSEPTAPLSPPEAATQAQQLAYGIRTALDQLAQQPGSTKNDQLTRALGLAAEAEGALGMLRRELLTLLPSEAAPLPPGYRRVRAGDLSIGDRHPRFGACDRFVDGAPLNPGMVQVGWENGRIAWVGAGTLFTVAKGED
jgi:hypothetical protein